jgi:hypothetical protein
MQFGLSREAFDSRFAGAGFLKCPNALVIAQDDRSTDLRVVSASFSVVVLMETFFQVVGTSAV